jgi:ABC-type branched-subunit amino acid transport system ATPase component
VAVDGLTLSVGEGEVRGLIGPNGSGKTTTINLLSGLYRADAGEVRLRGERVDHLRPHQIAGRGVARTFQISKVWGNMTVLENLLVPAFAEHDRGAGQVGFEVEEPASREHGATEAASFVRNADFKPSSFAFDSNFAEMSQSPVY